MSVLCSSIKLAPADQHTPSGIDGGFVRRAATVDAKRAGSTDGRLAHHPAGGQVSQPQRADRRDDRRAAGNFYFPAVGDRGLARRAAAQDIQLGIGVGQHDPARRDPFGNDDRHFQTPPLLKKNTVFCYCYFNRLFQYFSDFQKKENFFREGGCRRGGRDER